MNPPFSARNRGPHSQIDQDFPDSARNGLLHILQDWVRKGFIKSWSDVAYETDRISRSHPRKYGSDEEDYAREMVHRSIEELRWDKVLDFIEVAHRDLATHVEHWEDGEFCYATSVDEVREKMAAQIQNLFWEESLSFELREGMISRRGLHHSKEQIARAELVLGDSNLVSARQHYEKALKFFRQPATPDLENTVKEAVCAVEAAGKMLFPGFAGPTLADLLISFKKTGTIPGPILKTYEGLYAFRNSGEGVAHGGATGGTVTIQLAEYVLAVAASQIILLVSLSELDGSVPF